MITTAIVGASGYAGGELLRLLLAHSRVEVRQITSETYSGQYAHFVHPNLRGHTDLRFSSLADLAACDLLFLALPHGQAMERIDAFAALAGRIVDLSADFRLRAPAAYPQWYGHEHPAPEWLGRFVYGLPELHRGELAGARYASGTGCNAIVTLLALWPLYRRGLVRESVVEVKVGSSEGGHQPSPAGHHPERAGVMRTYAPVGHRHQAELIQELGLHPAQPGLHPERSGLHPERSGLHPERSGLHFSITSVGTVRGALATCHCLLHDELDERQAWQFYRDDYGQEPFVRLVRARRGIHRFPEPKILSGANYCDIGFVSDPGQRRLVVVAAIDNLMKGAAGNAVQTMNVMMGWEERLGLEFAGLHPI